MKQKSLDNKKSAPFYKGSGMAIGAALGLIFGVMLFDNLALGLVFGVAMGLGIGSMVEIQANKEGK